MKKNGSAPLSLLLVLVMLAGLLPVEALAAEGEYRYGTLRYFSTVTQDYVGDSWYYTDQWFLEDPALQNDGLALLSAQMAAAVTDTPEYGLDLLTGLGFSARAERFASDSPDDCAYVMGTRSIRKDGKDCTLLAVAFQGAGYGGKGWRQNVSVNGETIKSGDHAAYSAAAEAFLADYDRLSLSGHVILWITGQSRGGGVADLAAARLLDRSASPTVFGYTFESPAVTDDRDAHGARYGGIWNYLREDDPVPMLPPWGMTRYGQEVGYGPANHEDVAAELDRRAPAAGAFARGYDGDFDKAAEELNGLVSRLTAAVPSRAEYSARNTDRCTADGQTVQITYTYQAGLQDLCRLIFGGGGGSAGSLRPLLGELPGLVYARLEEVYAAGLAPTDRDALYRDAAGKRWAAAGALLEAAEDGAVTRSGLYAALKLLSPVLVDPGGANGGTAGLPEYDEAFRRSFFQYVSDDALTLLDSSGEAFFSHHSDVILARLRLLAPAPGMEDVALTIPAPRAGDASAAAPAAVRERTAALDRDWLAVEEARWLTEDAVLADDRTYWLSVTLAAAGHSVPGDFSFTVNGEKPVEQTVAWQGGKALVTGVWRIILGQPARLEEVPPLSGGGFSDVPAGAYFAAAVRWAAEQGIAQGTGAVRFSPDAPCTRAQMAVFLWRAAGQPDPSAAEGPFADVAGGAYYADAVRWAAERGITEGTDETRFSPDAALDRSQCVTFLYRLTGERTGVPCPFTDVPPDAYFAEAVNWAWAGGVTDGKTETLFAPADGCTRGQAVTFLYRAMRQG